MSTSERGGFLADAVTEVLETMFFTTLAGDVSPEAPGAPWIAASLSFRGAPPGRFGVRLPLTAARVIAANFLGRDEESLSGREVGEVTCELANILCGSLLSRLEKNTRFELSQPAFTLEVPGGQAEDQPVRQRFELEEGPLELWLELDPA